MLYYGTKGGQSGLKNARTAQQQTLRNSAPGPRSTLNDVFGLRNRSRLLFLDLFLRILPGKLAFQLIRASRTVSSKSDLDTLTHLGSQTVTA